MSEEKKNVVTEEGKEARELTNEELEQVTGGRAPRHHHQVRLCGVRR